MAKKKDSLMGAAKDTLKLGTFSMAGMGAMGAMSAIPGMPKEASGIAGITGAGLTLANVGQLSKTSMTVANQFETDLKKDIKGKKTKKKW